MRFRKEAAKQLEKENLMKSLVKVLSVATCLIASNFALAKTSVVECTIVEGKYNNFPVDMEEGDSDFKISLSYTSEGKNVLLSNDLILNISSPSSKMNSAIPTYTVFVMESIKVDFNFVTYDEKNNQVSGPERAVLLADKNSTDESAKEFQATLIYLGHHEDGSPWPSWNFDLTCPNR